MGKSLKKSCVFSLNCKGTIPNCHMVNFVVFAFTLVFGQFGLGVTFIFIYIFQIDENIQYTV